MQTFLPYPNFVASAMALDSRRLGKQRVEARQIQTSLQSGTGSGWRNHPAVRMWDGHILALMLYGDCMIREWVRRGFENSMPLMLSISAASEIMIPSSLVMPAWLGREDVHSSHRANLIRKDPEWYGGKGWTEQPVVGYVWPV